MNYLLMATCRKIIGLPITIVIGMIRIYQYAISPYFGPSCRFDPSCSAYATESLRNHGLFKGLWLAVKRVGRCHPWNRGGYDPVP